MKILIVDDEEMIRMVLRELVVALKTFNLQVAKEIKLNTRILVLTLLPKILFGYLTQIHDVL